MKVIFCRKRTLGSWLIRAWSWSPWSHLVIVEDSEHVIDSTFAHGGVRRRRLIDIVEEYSVIEEIEIPLVDEQAALDFVRAQLGKPYDWTAIFGFLLRRDWAEPDAWFCNELFEAAAVAGGRRRFRDDISHITPRESWMVCS
ncbi:hypothetical protein H5407_09165 [Mitsuaria sp. WAJ17]|uniref:hypothetical protein n=1 Tax=Mitsuaria sp. WAJ17 TaxID=2761452 RepID=UPI001603CBA3|nr:hypothetical protein [Mitsuaria sp. WAJ17]MBB2485395.1 hypothetical protein [Mitsuaria sp. WAJ17]